MTSINHISCIRTISYKNGYKIYSFPYSIKKHFFSFKVSFLEKLRTIYYRFINRKSYYISSLANFISINRVVNKEKIDLIVFFAFYLYESYVNLGKKNNAPKIFINHDPYLNRPNQIDLNYKEVELSLINSSCSYFVPFYVLNDYLIFYKEKNIYPFYYLYIEEKKFVLDILKSRKYLYQFSYFGILQSFRNSKEFKTLFDNLGMNLHIFESDYKIEGPYISWTFS